MLTEKRRTKRQRVVKSGKIIFGVADIAIDCLICDETSDGVLVETNTPVVVPVDVKIRLTNGGTYPAARRWALGNKIGFEFSGTRVFDPATIMGMSQIHHILQTQRIKQALLSLRRSGFFDNDEIRRVAEDAEAATLRLEQLLISN
ncbi:MAG: hypothetical protein POG74_03615 [Acidocella sp.]|nr:hypothetical protein [Acidocella sp.]